MRKTNIGLLQCSKSLWNYSSLSEALSSASNPKRLCKLHALLVTLGLHNSIFFSGKLISKYAHFKDHYSFLSVFDQLSSSLINNNVYLWNSVIRGLTQCGFFSKALEFYANMRLKEIRADTFTFPAVINACAASLDFEMGGFVHDHVVEMGYEFDLYIGNALVDMYARFRELGKARDVFNKMPKRDVVSWNSLISGLSANGFWEEALEVYYELRMSGLNIDSFTISSVLPACGEVVHFEEGEVIHGLVKKIGVDCDVIVCNGLLSMYFKFDRLKDAVKVFHLMVSRDSVSWNIMICGYSRMGLFEESINFFAEMVRRFKPDLLTITSVLLACGRLQKLCFGKYVHDYMMKNGFECDATAGNVLLDMYAKCGDLVASQEVFDRMKSRDRVSWNSLINGYAQGGNNNEVVKLYKMMKIEVLPDSFTNVTLLSVSAQLANLDLGKEIHCDITKLGCDSDLFVVNALVNMYAKCWKIKESLKVFDNMKVRDIVTWNTVIAACAETENCGLVFNMVRKMSSENVIPDIATMLSLLPLCSATAATLIGKEIHASIFKLGYESQVPIGNALIEMYSKCGNLKTSITVFEQMSTKDLVTWTGLISAYGMYGEGMKALQAFEKMEAAGITPDHVAYISVLYACSHSGLVKEGMNIFDRVEKDSGIEPGIELYACVVDLLSRSGELSKAEEFINKMPLKADASIWGSFLSACRARGNTEIAERVSQHIIELDSKDVGYYVLASNVFAASGKWDQVKRIRKLMISKGLKKEPGSSWIEIKKKVYAFGTGIKFSERHEEIIEQLRKLASLMEKEGYISDLQYALHDVEDDEKKDLLCGHSERLAIAFGLLNTKAGTSLQVMKNLRVCGDCHTWTKYVSKVAEREIMVRDANRFHLFRDGKCSCGDQW